jgi:bifunctional non-homologous end joining protein LigD
MDALEMWLEAMFVGAALLMLLCATVLYASVVLLFRVHATLQRSIRGPKVLRNGNGTARLPDFVEPMKAKLVDSIRTGDSIYEIKFDGYRALALRGGNETRALSRNEKDLGNKFPEVRASIAALKVQDVVIDGEIVALDEKGRSSFQLLQRFEMGQERPPIVFYAFDLLRLNGKDLQKLPIEERG